MNDRIVCAAIRHPETQQIICGARHYDTLMRAIILLLPEQERQTWYKEAEQGFVTNRFGRFVDRKEGWIIAEAAGQIIREVAPKGTLYSENLY